MNNRSERGIALIITLLMLSVVTLMAVTFLAISQREKVSVHVMSDLNMARWAADSAVAKAEAEIISRILATSNQFGYDLMVSTNLINPAGFQPGNSHPTNVSYTYGNGLPLQGEDLLQNIANLQYDARVPVFVDPVARVATASSQRGRTQEFRFFLDLNRNGMFEPSGFVPVLETNGQPIRVGPQRQIQFGHYSGDPQWIGMLERPDRPHSEDNRFIARYAYLVLPAGKSLDLNYIHNYVKGTSPNMTFDGFLRNQGVGSWELNLAGFFQALNTNSWPRDYVYNINLPSTGTAFSDALTILRHRYRGNPQQYLRPGLALFNRDTFDSYGDGPMFSYATVQKVGLDLDLAMPDDPNRPWPGSDNPGAYFDSQEFFDPNKVGLGLLTRLVAPMTNSLGSYDRYTLYRLLAQMGTDSKPAFSNLVFQADFRRWPTNKLHLNYRLSELGKMSDAQFWSGTNAQVFFHQAADRMMRVSLWTNIFTNTLGRLETNFMMGEIPVRREFAVTNIQIYHIPSSGLPFYATNNEYSSTTHRLLQLSANLLDATTVRKFSPNGPDYPSVFRPIFRKTTTNITISGYTEVINADRDLLQLQTLTPEAVMARFPGETDLLAVNIVGVPVIIGAKKGYPNFNEVSMETAVQVSRKLEVRKLNTNSPPGFTNQMYVIGISNIFGVEAWNSYTQDFRRANLEMVVTNEYVMALTNVVDNVAQRVRFMEQRASTNLVFDTWTNSTSPLSFIVPVHSRFEFLTNSAYFPRSSDPRFVFRDPRGTNNFENSFDPPQLYLYITNRVQYALVDRSINPPRIIDYVSLDNLVSYLDIGQALVGDTMSSGSGLFRDRARITENDMWDPTRVARQSLTGPTLGVLNQIAVGMGDPRVAADVWRSHIEDPVTGGDKTRAIQKFREFMTGSSTNIVMQVPYTPSRKFYLRNTWQANDPLVHYARQDLSDPVLTNPFATNNIMILRPPTTPLPASNLGRVNERYRPWGEKGSGDPTRYSLSIKDPMIRRSDDWSFPTNPFPNIGWIGRVHRGTPWQTVYLKATMETPNIWQNWAGSLGTHPTNDWKLVDVFTTAPNENAARGLLSVNQTNFAAWSAVFSGVGVLSNSLANPGPLMGLHFDDVYIHPNSTQLVAVVDGINRTRAERPKGVFEYTGEILATPELSVLSPFLNLSNPRQVESGLTDDAVERLPQQVLSLLTLGGTGAGEPRLVVYAFGQSLKPAERSLVTSGNFYNLCTNYQVTGEVVTKTVLRIDGAPDRPKAVVESFHVVPPE